MTKKTPKDIGHARLYKTLCKVLDALCLEAPDDDEIYRPTHRTNDAVIQARSRALLHLFLKARFGLIHFQDRAALITDGPQDGGIDAFYIDEKNKKIYLLQSKFRATAGNFVSNNMTADDLLKMDVRPILRGEKKDEAGNPYNDEIRNRLQKSIKKLPDAGNYTTQVVLLGNTKNFSAQQLKKLVEGYAVDQFPHERVYHELLFPVINGTYFTNPDLTIEINLTNIKGESNLDYSVKAGPLKPNIKLLFVPTREVGRIMHTYKNSILKFNPRSFLDLTNNPVNKEIEASIKNSTTNEFALFNNGLTIISDGTKISSDTAKHGKAQVVLRNPQLVNGGQTAYTLGRIYEECVEANDYNVFKGKEVLLRVISFTQSTSETAESAKLELVSAISKASNSQTKIEESDRRSNDEIQVKLQKEFFEGYGLYYERKRGEFNDGMRSEYISDDLIVNREKLIRIVLACDYRANQARSSIKKFFTPDTLTELLKPKDISKYAYGYEVSKRLEATLKSKPNVPGDRYHTKQYGQALRYGEYGVIAICVNYGLRAGKTPSDSLQAVLSQWIGFEEWVQKQTSNASYKTGASSFDFVNYYKGATINTDLQGYPFSL